MSKCEQEKQEILEALKDLTEYYTAERMKRAILILKKHNYV